LSTAGRFRENSCRSSDAADGKYGGLFQVRHRFIVPPEIGQRTPLQGWSLRPALNEYWHYRSESV
jgi:hypothetical protein